MEWLPAIVVYVFSLAVYAFMKRRELAADQAKAQRYRVLPLHLKLACWCGVLPLIAAVPLAFLFVFDAPYLAVLSNIIGLAAFAGLELACVPVYRRHGLWK